MGSLSGNRTLGIFIFDMYHGYTGVHLLNAMDNAIVIEGHILIIYVICTVILGIVIRHACTLIMVGEGVLVNL